MSLKIALEIGRKPNRQLAEIRRKIKLMELKVENKPQRRVRRKKRAHCCQRQQKKVSEPIPTADRT